MNRSATIEYYGNTRVYGKNDVVQQRYLEDIVLYIAKRYITLFAIENPWFHHLDLLRPDSRVKFSTMKQFAKEIIPSILQKTIEHYVLPTLVSCATI